MSLPSTLLRVRSSIREPFRAIPYVVVQGQGFIQGVGVGA